MGVLGRGRPRRDGRRRPATRSRSAPRDGAFLAWPRTARIADPRARLELGRARAIDAGFFARACAPRRSRGAPLIAGARAPCGSCTARPTGCRAWSAIATATSPFAVLVCRRRALARADRRRCARRNRLHAWRTSARTPTCARSRALRRASGPLARRAASGTRGDRRARPALPRRRRARPEDRLLSRPAREPRSLSARSPPAATCSTASATPAASP